MPVLVRNDRGQAIPAAMSLLIETYPHLDTRQPPAEAAFLWFLASAPDDALAPVGVSPTPKLGATCIDIAITASFNAVHDGRIGLHAARADLVPFYRGCGLLQLPALLSLPVPRGNDGRFFYTDEVVGASLAATFAASR